MITYRSGISQRVKVSLEALLYLKDFDFALMFSVSDTEKTIIESCLNDAYRICMVNFQVHGVTY